MKYLIGLAFVAGVFAVLVILHFIAVVVSVLSFFLGSVFMGWLFVLLAKLLAKKETKLVYKKIYFWAIMAIVIGFFICSTLAHWLVIVGFATGIAAGFFVHLHKKKK